MQVTLECGAHNTGYCKPDIASSCPKGECCVEGAVDEATTCLNMEELLEQVLTLMVRMVKIMIMMVVAIMMRTRQREGKLPPKYRGATKTGQSWMPEF